MAGDPVVKDGDKVAGGEELQTLKTQIEEMQGEVNNLTAAKADLEKMRDEADKQLLSPEYLEFLEGRKDGTKKSDSKDGKDVNFEEMTSAQIAKHFADAYKGDLDKAITSITKRMDSVDTGLGRAFAQIDLTLTSIKHADLGAALELPIGKRTAEQKALVDTIHKVATDNPSWSSAKCYKQAKMEMKMSAEEKEQVEKENAEKENKLLSEKPGASAAVLKGKEMDKETASSVAWKHAFGNKTSVEG